MVKLSIAMAFFFSFVAFARADDSAHKLSFGLTLCQQGHADNYQSCANEVNQRNLGDVSFYRLASDVCPVAGGRSGQLILRCLNKANERFGLSIRFCNNQQTYRRRVHCVQTVFTQADNQRMMAQQQLGQPLNGKGTPSRDDSSRDSVDKASNPAPVPAEATPGAAEN